MASRILRPEHPLVAPGGVIDDNWHDFFRGLQQEGTWTPTPKAATAGNFTWGFGDHSAKWRKTGPLVVLQLDLGFTTFTHTTAAGQFTIAGMPFPAIGDYAGAMIFSGINKAGGYTQICAVTAAGFTEVAFECSGMGVAVATLTMADIPTGGNPLFRFVVPYFTKD